MNLADNLKRIRKDNNLSQEQLAEKLGVSRQEYRDISTELDRLKELIINSNVEVIFDDNGKIVGIYKYKEEIE